MTVAASTAVDVATVVAGVVAVIGIVGPLRAYFNRTLGRRFDLYRRFKRLGVGAQESFYEAVIGEAPAIRRPWTIELQDFDADIDDLKEDFPLVPRTFTEALWVDPLFYAQTVADETGTVLGFSITTRTRRFAPRFAAPLPVATNRWLLDRLTRGRWRMPTLAHADGPLPPQEATGDLWRGPRRPGAALRALARTEGGAHVSAPVRPATHWQHPRRFKSSRSSALSGRTALSRTIWTQRTPRTPSAQG
jgi:hypothetical protein